MEIFLSGSVLVTGATGFIGSALIVALHRLNTPLRAAILPGKEGISLPEEVERVVVPPLSESSDYTAALMGVDFVVHLAARVHVLLDQVSNPLNEFRKVNVHGTERLARQAAAAGVKRMVFLSSVKVNGEGMSRPFTENDTPVPESPYGVSKHEAEQALLRVAAETCLEVVIIRSPLVYGPGVKANFLHLLKTVDKGMPLPFAGVRNRRSFVYVGNLVNAIILCMTHPKAANQIYLVSDGEDISTPELIRRLGFALDKPTRLVTIPPFVIRFSGRVFGKSEAVKRLVESLQIDCSKIRRELGWHPLYTMEQGLRETVEWYKNNARHQDRS